MYNYDKPENKQKYKITYALDTRDENNTTEKFVEKNSKKLEQHYPKSINKNNNNINNNTSSNNSNSNNNNEIIMIIIANK